MMEEEEKQIVIVGMADIKIGKAPLLLRTNLGSCIAVCLYDQEQKVGGMLHFMLADSTKSFKEQTEIKRAKFADTGVEDMVKTFKQHYMIDPAKLEAKVFGGAKVLSMCSLDIGKENEEAVKAVLQSYNIKLQASKTGGDKGYKVDFDLDTGKVICQVFKAEEEEF